MLRYTTNKEKKEINDWFINDILIACLIIDEKVDSI